MADIHILVPVFNDLPVIRLLLALPSFIGILALSLIAKVVIRLFTEVAIPGWATIAYGLVPVLLVQSVVFAVLLLFISLRTRGLAESISALRNGDSVAARRRLRPEGKRPDA